MADWMFYFLDAVIAGDLVEALRIAYTNEGEQMSWLEEFRI